MSVSVDQVQTTQSPLRPRYLAMAFVAFALMTAAIVSTNAWFLNFVHVFAGLLWTGIDLFMGFVMGPVLRQSSPETRRFVTIGLVPRTLVLMPTLSIVTSTSGWFLALQRGYFDLGYPEFWWVIAALAIITVLTIQGLGILLPTNLRMFYEIQRSSPDHSKIARWMRTFLRVVAIQGTMQVLIIVVMAKFVAGL
jgi:hypothetical protein